MPLTAKGSEVLSSMIKEYGEAKGKEVFYASRNAGKITGVDSDEPTVTTPLMPAPDPVRVRGAGIMFMTKAGEVLYLRRGPGGDYPGDWCFPGGTTEDGETAEDTAKRETVEEIGHLPEGERFLQARTITPIPAGEVDFTTFIQRVPERFDPEVDGEHVGFAWAPANDPPEPLHPGCRIALARLTMDELDLARAMASGQLMSPQRHMNVSLFDMRITGTGVAYRSAKNEFVYRRPEHYLTPDFLARCNGLPVIWVHPKGNTLDSKEFGDRIVGTMLLPYIKGDEVWGIAKLYDDATIAHLLTNQMSTSPGVVLRGAAGGDQKMTLDDGTVLLIEGKPCLLDHLAICEHGVWDKGGEPVGIRSENTGDLVMTEAEQAAADKAKKDAEDEKARKDAETSSKLDKILDLCDSTMKKVDAVNSRVDAMEMDAKARKDAEDKAKKDAEEETEAKRVAADKAKKDADEKEEERKKADAARTDSQVTKKDFEDLKGLIPRQMTDEDFAALARAQARADQVYTAFGDSAPRHATNETPEIYRRRIAMALKTHSPAWKAFDLTKLDSDSFGVAEDQILNDAMKAASSPAGVPPGQLRMRSRKLESGHTVNEFYGEPSAWMDGFAGPVRQALSGRGFRTPA